MPNETRKEAEARAEKEGFPKSSVYCLDGDNMCYIAPHGITASAAKKAYAEARANGNDKATSAKIAWTIQNKIEESRNMKVDRYIRAIQFERDDEMLCHARKDVKAETIRNEQTGEKSYVSRGYAVLFNSPTEVWTKNGKKTEVVLPSAFDKVDFRDTPILWNHDTSQPMGWNGVNLRIEKDDVCIFWELNHYSNPIEKDRHDKMSSGKMGCSFGFCGKFEERNGVQYVTEVTDCMELTITAFPAYKDTIAIAMRDEKPLIEKRKDESKQFTLQEALQELKEIKNG